MRRLLPILILLLPTFAVPTENVLIGTVVKVTDGDTITVLTADNLQERIRLYGIDVPEKRGAQPFWQASRDQLASMVAGKTVTVIWGTKDRNGRNTGWVIDSDGIWVNTVMVLTGMAWWYEAYAREDDRLKDAQETAREKQLIRNGLLQGGPTRSPEFRVFRNATPRRRGRAGWLG